MAAIVSHPRYLHASAQAPIAQPSAGNRDSAPMRTPSVLRQQRVSTGSVAPTYGTVCVTVCRLAGSGNDTEGKRIPAACVVKGRTPSTSRGRNSTPSRATADHHQNFACGNSGGYGPCGLGLATSNSQGTLRAGTSLNAGQWPNSPEARLRAASASGSGVSSSTCAPVPNLAGQLRASQASLALGALASGQFGPTPEAHNSARGARGSGPSLSACQPHNSARGLRSSGASVASGLTLAANPSGGGGGSFSAQGGADIVRQHSQRPQAGSMQPSAAPSIVLPIGLAAAAANMGSQSSPRLHAMSARGIPNPPSAPSVPVTSADGLAAGARTAANLNNIALSACCNTTLSNMAGRGCGQANGVEPRPQSGVQLYSQAPHVGCVYWTSPLEPAPGIAPAGQPRVTAGKSPARMRPSQVVVVGRTPVRSPVRIRPVPQVQAPHCGNDSPALQNPAANQACAAGVAAIPPGVSVVASPPVAATVVDANASFQASTPAAKNTELNNDSPGRLGPNLTRQSTAAVKAATADLLANATSEEVEASATQQTIENDSISPDALDEDPEFFSFGLGGLEEELPEKVRGRLTFEECIHFAEMQFVEHLGSGEFGQVFRGFCKNQEVAIKQLYWDDSVQPEVVIQDLTKEIESFRHLRHKRLVSFVGACLEMPNLCLVTEYMPGGSLHHLLHVRKVRLPPKHSINMCLQLCDGVLYLHTRVPVVVHRDLKSLNVVLDMNLNIKLCDFGLTESMDRTHITRKSNGGSPRYMAPELFDHKSKITEKVDIWSMGCLFTEIFGGPLPYQGINTLPDLAREMIVLRKTPEIPPNVAEPVQSIIRSCYNFDTRLRPSAKQTYDQLREGKRWISEQGF